MRTSNAELFIVCVFGAIVIVFFFCVVAIVAMSFGHRIRLWAKNEEGEIGLETPTPDREITSQPPKPLAKKVRQKRS